jgi:amidohydrolase
VSLPGPRRLLDEARVLGPRLSAWRRTLHRRPELGLDCPEAAALVAGELSGLGFSLRTGLAGSGVAAVLRGGPGPAAALRVDMDALPLNERTGLAFASEIPGRMHACGHDGHTALGLGVAHLLAARAGSLGGDLLLIFQPGEEYPGGARPMLEAGVLADPDPAVILGCHLNPALALGRVAVCSGPATAGNEEFSITLTGTGGHAARPAECRNPIPAAARLVLDLEDLAGSLARQPEPAVLSVTQVQAGEGHNVIPQDVRIKGTLRFFQERTRQAALAAMARLCMDMEAATGVAAAFASVTDAPPMLLPPDLALRVRDWCAELAGPERVDLPAPASMGAEDFAFFAQARPAAYLRLGCADALRRHGLHTPFFDFDEAVLPGACALLAWCLLRLLQAAPGCPCTGKPRREGRKTPRQP